MAGAVKAAGQPQVGCSVNHAEAGEDEVESKQAGREAIFASLPALELRLVTGNGQAQSILR